MQKRAYTLKELNAMVRDAIETELPDEYWVQAELAECRESRGHCYMELIEKDELNNTPIARSSAKCWKSTWNVVRPYFERETGQRLHAGMKVLLKVYAQFHEAFGFSWIVTDIDPTYTLGDMARRRQEIIAHLKAEGVFDLNRELYMPLFPQRIAVISSATAAGYGDFCNQLADNPYGFYFSTQLFEATMQGEATEQSIIQALNRIYLSVNSFDVVVIIRGGGATSDLSCFDSLPLAENVANFPLPVITGIGHDRDESIIDMVAHTNVKTPTAAAALLISYLKDVLDAINQAEATITRRVRSQLEMEKLRLNRITSILPRLFPTIKARQETRLDALYNRISSHVGQTLLTCNARLITLEQKLPLVAVQRISTEKHRLAIMEEKSKLLDPTLLLSRGYSITLKDGKAIRDPKSLTSGDEIVTRLEKGTIKSIIK
ncbi:MAG: exodeoxyribonuclease VII large subunit [Prevotella sp.]|jgi:exodeoxyribonuclease VII large subunit|nr:exodeoxyribonuclease VII large subunit [Prevotella sp.]